MAIAFHDVRKVWPNGTCGLDGISLAVPAGQFCVLMGHSGAGKSTLLRCVNGLERPSSGTVQVGGSTVDARSLPGLRRRIAMVHQDFRLVPRASVASNVMSGAAPALPLWRVLAGAYPAALRDRACALLQAVGLRPDQLGQRADQLSGGQQQRLGIARALMLAPSVLLADEPVASLDPGLARDVLGLLRDLARHSGTTVLCSLHQPHLAAEFADRIVMLNAGRMTFDGPPADDWASEPARFHPAAHPAAQPAGAHRGTMPLRAAR
jgi:phosphonate transport system ATP-binding protein